MNTMTREEKWSAGAARREAAEKRAARRAARIDAKSRAYWAAEAARAAAEPVMTPAQILAIMGCESRKEIA